MLVMKSDVMENLNQYEFIDDCFSDNFYRIFKFFVFYSPCPGQGGRMISLSNRGWNEKPWNSPAYLKERLDKAIFQCGIRLYKVANSHQEFKANIDSLDLNTDLVNKRNDQRFCIVKVSQEVV